MPEQQDETNSEKSFEELSQDKQLGLATEFLMFIKENKIWWMLPIILVLGMVGVLAFLTTTGAAPFIYTLF
jgi:hypothetical protein